MSIAHPCFYLVQESCCNQSLVDTSLVILNWQKMKVTTACVGLVSIVLIMKIPGLVFLLLVLRCWWELQRYQLSGATSSIVSIEERNHISTLLSTPLILNIVLLQSWRGGNWYLCWYQKSLLDTSDISLEELDINSQALHALELISNSSRVISSTYRVAVWATKASFFFVCMLFSLKSAAIYTSLCWSAIISFIAWRTFYSLSIFVWCIIFWGCLFCGWVFSRFSF